MAILVNGRLDKILERRQWKDKDGGLESIFTERVAGQGEVGPLAFAGAGEGR